jgi:hypothetical protein
VHRRYNKRESDFESARAYDDYLEEVEDISMWNGGDPTRTPTDGVLAPGCARVGPVYNLMHNVDRDATLARVATYKEQNAAQISRNKTLAVRRDPASLPWGPGHTR